MLLLFVFGAASAASTLRPTHSSLLATLEALEADLASLTALSAERSTRRDSTGVAPGEFWNWHDGSGRVRFAGVDEVEYTEDAAETAVKKAGKFLRKLPQLVKHLIAYWDRHPELGRTQLGGLLYRELARLDPNVLTLVLTEISQLKMDTWAVDEWQWIREMMSGSGVIDDYRDLFTAHGLAKPFFLSETIKKM